MKLRRLSCCVIAMSLLSLLKAGGVALPAQEKAPVQAAPVPTGTPETGTVETGTVQTGTVPPGTEAGGQTRPVASAEELRAWLQNMVWHHRYSIAEVSEVLGVSTEEVQRSLGEFGISAETKPVRNPDHLLMLPYPGGRHPRIGFLDGAINPQRETKLSVFCPWDDQSYVVMDVPEAVWSNLGLTYLAHTHIDTIWDKAGQKLPQLEWTQNPDRSYSMERTLPNGIVFGTRAIAHADHIEMDMWLTNNTPEVLTDLRVQNCVMLKGAVGFDQQISENKQFIQGYATAHSPDRTRWIISAWSPVQRAWGNPPCPCLHSDPQFPNCRPGETQRLRGWQSFYSGTRIEAEIARIEATNWKTEAKNREQVTSPK